MIKKVVNILAVVIVFAAVSSAQSLLGAQYPLGIPLRQGTGPSLSMGSVGTGVINDFFGMSKNPANLGAMNRALFSGLLSLQYTQIRDHDQTTLQNAFQPKSFFFAFPLAKYGALGFGFNQLSQTNLKFNMPGTVSSGNLTLESPRGMVVDGGAAAWQIGYGLTVLKKLRIGLNYERMYFRNATTTFKMVGGSLSDSLIDSTGLLVTANGVSGGLMYSIDKLTMGMSVKAYQKADEKFSFQNRGTQREFKVTSSTDANGVITYDTVPAEKVNTSSFGGKVSLPPSLALGLSYQLRPEWIVAADFDMTLWNRYHSDRSLQAENSLTLSNASSFAIGTQYVPAPNLLTPKYFEIIQYRAGWRISRLPGDQAYETAVTLGAGLPLRKGGGIFDLCIEAGRRWDKRYSQYSENFVGFQIGVNGGQKWYQTTEEGY